LPSSVPLKVPEYRLANSRRKHDQDALVQRMLAYLGSRSLPSLIDLEGQAREFAAEVSDLLNRTVADGIRLKSVIANRRATTVHVSYGISPEDLTAKPVPLGIRRTPRLSPLGRLHTGARS